MKEQFTVSGYQITKNPKFQNNRYDITPELEKQFDSLYYQAQNKNDKKVIDKLIKLIIQYPKVPILKNYLTVAYNVQGKYLKSKEVNQQILTEHPEYLFGILNKANQLINSKEFNKVPEIMGEAMELKALYPDRDLFHLIEVTGFYKLAIRYYVGIENLELAENRLETLKEIAPEHNDTEESESYLFGLRLKYAAKRLEEENRQRISPSRFHVASKSNKTAAPKFNHPEIQNLYNFGIAIPHDVLKEIIALPHASLVKDLEKMLVDSVERYDYFSNLEWNEETHNFVLHALFLLKEVNAVKSLPSIISFFKYDVEFIEFWIGDHITDTIWQCFYSLGIYNTAILKDYLLLPGVDTYCKTAVSEALCQMVLHHPDKREEILTIFLDVFNSFSEAIIDDNLIDSDFLGLSISDAMDCNLFELLPVIEVLYKKCFVSIGVNGNFEDVEKHFANPSRVNHKRELYDVFELYDYVLNTWSGYKEKAENYNSYIPSTPYKENFETFNSYTPTPAVSNKIGRNEQCPCGSGKKYKKCCGGY